MPEAMPLAMAMMSGLTPACSIANILPVRPMPDCTSSTTSRMPCSSVKLAQPLEELRRRHDVAALALNRLDDDRRHFVRRHQVHEQLVLDEVEALGGAGVRRRARPGSDSSRRYGAWKTPGMNGPKPRRWTGLLAVSASEPMRAAVKPAEERDDVRPPGRVTRQLDARLDGLGAGVGEERPGAAVDRHQRRRSPPRAAPARRSRSRCPTCAGSAAPDR